MAKGRRPDRARGGGPWFAQNRQIPQMPGIGPWCRRADPRCRRHRREGDFSDHRPHLRHGPVAGGCRGRRAHLEPGDEHPRQGRPDGKGRRSPDLARRPRRARCPRPRQGGARQGQCAVGQRHHGSEPRQGSRRQGRRNPAGLRHGPCRAAIGAGDRRFRSGDRRRRPTAARFHEDHRADRRTPRCGGGFGRRSGRRWLVQRLRRHPHRGPCHGHARSTRSR